MQLTNEGFNFIKSHEGLRLEAYPDPGTGGEPWTIGYGHTSLAGPPKVTPGMRITKAEADAILRKDLRKFEDAVKRNVKVPLNDNQYSAIVSFTFNCGEGNLQKSGVLKAINQKKFDLVPSRLMLWNKAAGKVLPGLTRRRAEEGKMFAKPVAHVDPVEPEAPEPTPVPDKPQGKPLAKSKTFWSQIAQWVAGGGAAALTALGEIPWQTALVVAGSVIIAAGGYIIYERYLKARDEGV